MTSIVVLFQNNASIICGAQSKHNKAVKRDLRGYAARPLTSLLGVFHFSHRVAKLNGP